MVKRNVYEVKWDGRLGWKVKPRPGKILKSCRTCVEAVKAGRKIAKKNKPSTLRVFSMNGDKRFEHKYG